MYKIQTLNKISPTGLDIFPTGDYEIASEFSDPDSILVRSASLHDLEFNKNLKSIARAGAGVNNIPIEKCTEKGIVVFNTPGANANAVKELVISGMFMASRNIPDALRWIDTLKGSGEEIPRIVEKNKSNFAGNELQNKKLGVIGLGAIGVMVANTAISLGMKVAGYDPFISVDNAWGLANDVEKSTSFDMLLAECDYLSIHVPLTDTTKGMINSDKFKMMKKNATLLNFARGGLVNNLDLKDAIKNGIIKYYVTDFPDNDLLDTEGIICIPHLGASTAEAEENCAVMAVNQIRNFLEKGNIKNSVNFPDCELPVSSKNRLIIANRNIPNMVGQITAILAKKSINISDLLNKHKNDLAYNIIDVDQSIDTNDIEDLKKIDGILSVRLLENLIS